MGFKILSPIQHGKEGEIFHLKPSDVVEDDFFTSREIESLITLKVIEHSKDLPTAKVMTAKPKFMDILSLPVTDAKEIIENEFDLTTLEKYVDQCRAHEFSPSAKKILKTAERKIHELTGHVYARG